MTFKSSRNQLERRGESPRVCMPTAIDSMLPVSTLPDEYYDLWTDEYDHPNSSFNKAMSTTLKGFFEVEPMPETEFAAVAKFNAFGASPQVYMPDAPYEYPDETKYFLEHGVTPQQSRFLKLLEIARDNGSNILFTSNDDNIEHVSALHMMYDGAYPANASYIVRDYGKIATSKIYRPSELAGIHQTLGIAEATKFTPLPTVQRSYFPNGESSYELIILPPDPKL